MDTRFRGFLAENDLEAPYSNYFPRVSRYDGGGFLDKACRVHSVIIIETLALKWRVHKDFNPDLIHCFAIYGRLTPAILDAATAASVPVVLVQ